MGALNDMELGDRVPQVVLEELVHLGGVGPGFAQESGGLKGTAAGAHGKALGVQHNAGQQGLGLLALQVAGVQDVLDQLRHQLTGGGGVGIVEAEGGLFDIGGGPAVVVDDHDSGPGVKQLWNLGLFRAVGVHHHQNGVGTGQVKGLIRRHKNPLVLRQGGQLTGLLLGGVGGGGPDGLNGDPFFSGNGAHTGHRPQNVQVGVLVPHDDHLVRAGQQLGKGGGHHPAFHLGAAFGFLGAAAEEEEFSPVPDDHLVAAPAQRHVQGQGGEFVELPGRGAVAAEADGEGGGDAVGALYLPDLI